MGKGEIPVELRLELTRIYRASTWTPERPMCLFDLTATIINTRSEKIIPSAKKVVKFYNSSNGAEVGCVETEGGASVRLLLYNLPETFHAVLYFADREIRSNDVVVEPV